MNYLWHHDESWYVRENDVSWCGGISGSYGARYLISPSSGVANRHPEVHITTRLQSSLEYHIGLANWIITGAWQRLHGDISSTGVTCTKSDNNYYFEDDDDTWCPSKISRSIIIGTVTCRVHSFNYTRRRRAVFVILWTQHREPTKQIKTLPVSAWVNENQIQFGRNK